MRRLTHVLVICLALTVGCKSDGGRESTARESHYVDVPVAVKIYPTPDVDATVCGLTARRVSHVRIQERQGPWYAISRADVKSTGSAECANIYRFGWFKIPGE